MLRCTGVSALHPRPRALALTTPWLRPRWWSADVSPPVSVGAGAGFSPAAEPAAVVHSQPGALPFVPNGHHRPDPNPPRLDPMHSASTRHSPPAHRSTGSTAALLPVAAVPDTAIQKLFQLLVPEGHLDSHSRTQLLVTYPGTPALQLLAAPPQGAVAGAALQALASAYERDGRPAEAAALLAAHAGRTAADVRWAERCATQGDYPVLGQALAVLRGCGGAPSGELVAALLHRCLVERRFELADRLLHQPAMTLLQPRHPELLTLHWLRQALGGRLPTVLRGVPGQPPVDRWLALLVAHGVGGRPEHAWRVLQQMAEAGCPFDVAALLAAAEGSGPPLAASARQRRVWLVGLAGEAAVRALCCAGDAPAAANAAWALHQAGVPTQTSTDVLLAWACLEADQLALALWALRRSPAAAPLRALLSRLVAAQQLAQALEAAALLTAVAGAAEGEVDGLAGLCQRAEEWRAVARLMSPQTVSLQSFLKALDALCHDGTADSLREAVHLAVRRGFAVDAQRLNRLAVLCAERDQVGEMEEVLLAMCERLAAPEPATAGAALGAYLRAGADAAASGVVALLVGQGGRAGLSLAWRRWKAAVGGAARAGDFALAEKLLNQASLWAPRDRAAGLRAFLTVQASPRSLASPTSGWARDPEPPNASPAWLDATPQAGLPAANLDPAVHFALAGLHFRSGQPGRAAAALRTLAAAGGRTPPAEYSRVLRALLGQGQLHAAVQWFVEVSSMRLCFNFDTIHALCDACLRAREPALAAEVLRVMAAQRMPLQPQTLAAARRHLRNIPVPAPTSAHALRQLLLGLPPAVAGDGSAPVPPPSPENPKQQEVHPPLDTTQPQRPDHSAPPHPPAPAPTALPADAARFTAALHRLLAQAPADDLPGVARLCYQHGLHAMARALGSAAAGRTWPRQESWTSAAPNQASIPTALPSILTACLSRGEYGPARRVVYRLLAADGTDALPRAAAAYAAAYRARRDPRLLEEMAAVGSAATAAVLPASGSPSHRLPDASLAMPEWLADEAEIPALPSSTPALLAIARAAGGWRDWPVLEAALERLQEVAGDGTVGAWPEAVAWRSAVLRHHVARGDAAAAARWACGSAAPAAAAEWDSLAAACELLAAEGRWAEAERLLDALHEVGHPPPPAAVRAVAGHYAAARQPAPAVELLHRLAQGGALGPTEARQGRELLIHSVRATAVQRAAQLCPADTEGHMSRQHERLEQVARTYRAWRRLAETKEAAARVARRCRDLHVAPLLKAVHSAPPIPHPHPRPTTAPAPTAPSATATATAPPSLPDEPPPPATPLTRLTAYGRRLRLPRLTFTVLTPLST